MANLATQNNSLRADPLASVRQYIIEDNLSQTVFKLPIGTRFIPTIELLSMQYRKIQYKINMQDGTTSIVTCFKG